MLKKLFSMHSTYQMVLSMSAINNIIHKEKLHHFSYDISIEERKTQHIIFTI